MLVRILSLAVPCLALALAGCTSIDPYTGQEKTSNTTKGAVIGAVAAAAAGAATGDNSKERKERILKGAVVGGAVGGGIGYYMDRQEAVLRQKLQGSGVQVSREGDNIQLIMPGNITFATGRYEIKSNFYSVLDSVSTVLEEFDRTAIKISGHTDSTGGIALNQTLSEQRADSVRVYLVNRNIASGRVQAVGYGPRYPIASNSSTTGREQNRRVELELLPLDN